MAIAPADPVRRLTLGDLESIIERALEEARARGATQAEAAVSQDSGLSVGVRLGEVETLEHQRDRSMGITVYFGHRKGSASTADFSPEAVRGGPIGLVQDGDEITLDVTNRRLDVAVSEEEMAVRAQRYTPPEKPYPGPALAKYASLVSSASDGAVTTPVPAPVAVP